MNAAAKHQLIVINTEWTRKAFETSDTTVLECLKNVCGIYWVPYMGFLGGWNARKIARALNNYLRGRNKNYAFGKTIQRGRAANNVYKQRGSDTLEKSFSSIKKNTSIKIKGLSISKIISDVCQYKIYCAIEGAISEGFLNFKPNVVFSMDLLHSRDIPVFEDSVLELRRDHQFRKFTFKQKMLLAIKKGLSTLYGSVNPCARARRCRKNIYSWKTCRKTHERKALEMVKSYVSPAKRKVLEFDSLKPVIETRLKKEIASVIRKTSRHAKLMNYSLREYFSELHHRIYDLVPSLSQDIIPKYGGINDTS